MSLTGLAVLVSAGLPAIARAHGPVDPAASSDLAVVRSTPPGIRVRVVDGDLRLWMHVSSPATVTVLDYQGAPYLRFTPSGVDINAESAMYYLNQRPPEIPPTRLGAHTSPRWFKTTSGHSFEWHDGRLHALATTLSSPGARDLGRWAVPLRIAGRRATISGVLDHRPAPSAGWWWPIAIVLFGLPAVLRLGDRALDRRLARCLSWVAVPALVVASVAAGLHGRPGPAPSRLLELTLELVVAAWASWNLRKARHETFVFFLVAFAAIYRGVAALTVLWRGYVLLALPATISRCAVVTCLAAGCGLLATAFVLSSPERSPSAPTPALRRVRQTDGEQAPVG